MINLDKFILSSVIGILKSFTASFILFIFLPLALVRFFPGLIKVFSLVADKVNYFNLYIIIGLMLINVNAYRLMRKYLDLGKIKEDFLPLRLFLVYFCTNLLSGSLALYVFMVFISLGVIISRLLNLPLL